MSSKRVSFHEHEDEDEEEMSVHTEEYSNGRRGFNDRAQGRPSIPPPVIPFVDNSAVQSPVRKKITALQDRRVNTVLLEALQLIEFSKDEVQTIEKSVKKLRDAIFGFSILVDKQVNIIGVETLEERGRIKVDIQDLAENLKISYEVFASTCNRMKQTLTTGKQHVQVHKKRVAARTPAEEASPSRPTTQSSQGPVSPASVSGNALLLEPGPNRSSLLSVLHPASNIDDDSFDPGPYMTPELFDSVLESVGLSEKEFLETKDLIRFAQEMLTSSIARSRALSFMGKAFHRRLIPGYAKDLVGLICDELQLTAMAPSLSPYSSSAPTISLPQNTFYDYACERLDNLLDAVYIHDANDFAGEPSPNVKAGATPSPNPFNDHITRNGGVLHGGKVVQHLLVNRPDPELLEMAEQTLAMAKLLHDLATAENEAKHGDRLSIRPSTSRAQEFSKTYLATSKELLLKESGVN
ncbi:hypothetical protein Poli38472_010049 [Pythium oligandrum]|uniref:Uncharacterized protein n=1 Tax=Pythium oligandrum TaxID=41045 RepID=A0A8K1C8Z8_PYTOL|nr:hypothetical protein Poli38472_010049 [Pythium oligandrum]|eukprot:TMW58490.1 hypothetical protein Poli38472_010049 [Pythium oligandrum]